MPITITPFRADLSPAFAKLNRAWIERLFTIEASDLKVLNDPESAIIGTGGQIFFAIDNDVAVGTVALIPTGASEYELAKMAVAPSHQGQGIGFLLGERAVRWATEHQASCLFLLTNSSLAGAIRLYQRLGFEHRPLPGNTGYARADVYMEHPLRK